MLTETQRSIGPALAVELILHQSGTLMKRQPLCLQLQTTGMRMLWGVQLTTPIYSPTPLLPPLVALCEEPFHSLCNMIVLSNKKAWILCRQGQGMDKGTGIMKLCALPTSIPSPYAPLPCTYTRYPLPSTVPWCQHPKNWACLWSCISIPTPTSWGKCTLHPRVLMLLRGSALLTAYPPS